MISTKLMSWNEPCGKSRNLNAALSCGGINPASRSHAENETIAQAHEAKAEADQSFTNVARKDLSAETTSIQ